MLSMFALNSGERVAWSAMTNHAAYFQRHVTVNFNSFGCFDKQTALIFNVLPSSGLWNSLTQSWNLQADFGCSESSNLHVFSAR